MPMLWMAAGPGAITDHDAAGGPDTSTGDDTNCTAPIPACPELFSPHPYKIPAVVTPSEWEDPAATADHDTGTPVSTGTGIIEELKLLMPSWPKEFPPQPDMVEPDEGMDIPRESDRPAVTAVHDAPPKTATGELTLVKLLVPSWPEVLRPHPYAAPVVVIPSECCCPADTRVQLAPAGPETSTGDETDVNERIPTSPDVLVPQP